MKEPRDRFETRFLAATGHIYGDISTLHIFEDSRSDAHPVAEEHIIEVYIELNKWGTTALREEVVRHTRAVDKPQHSTATHNILVDDKFITLRESGKRFCHYNSAIVVEHGGIVSEYASIYLEISAEGFTSVIHLIFREFAMAFKESDFFYFRTVQYSDGIDNLKFKVLNGSINSLFSLHTCRGFHKADSHSISTATQFRPREDNLLRHSTVSLAFCNAHTTQTSTFQLRISSITGFIINLFIRIFLHNRDWETGFYIHLFHRLFHRFRQAEHIGIQIPRKIKF